MRIRFSCPLAFLLGAAGLASSSLAAPQSGHWGEDFEPRLERVFAEMRWASGVPFEVKLAFFLSDPPAVAKDVPVQSYDPAHAPGRLKNRGGLVVATADLFDMARDEDELAFLLAHELAHIELRHQSLADSYSKGASPAAYAAYLRSQELEADRIGVQIVQQWNISNEAKYRQSGACALLHMKDLFWAKGGVEDTVTHPPAVERAKKLADLTGQGCRP